MDTDLAGDASLVLKTSGALNGQDFDYTLYPPNLTCNKTQY